MLTLTDDRIYWTPAPSYDSYDEYDTYQSLYQPCLDHNKRFKALRYYMFVQGIEWLVSKLSIMCLSFVDWMAPV